MNGCIYRTGENLCKFYSNNGAGIVSYCDYEGCVDKHPSNADKIRAMADEELNAWFMGVCHAVAEFSCSGCQFEYLYGEDCGFLSWLKKEASDDSFVHTGP